MRRAEGKYRCVDENAACVCVCVYLCIISSQSCSCSCFLFVRSNSFRKTNAQINPLMTLAFSAPCVRFNKKKISDSVIPGNNSSSLSSPKYDKILKCL